MQSLLHGSLLNKHTSSIHLSKVEVGRVTTLSGFRGHAEPSCLLFRRLFPLHFSALSHSDYDTEIAPFKSEEDRPAVMDRRWCAPSPQLESVVPRAYVRLHTSEPKLPLPCTAAHTQIQRVEAKT